MRGESDDGPHPVLTVGVQLQADRLAGDWVRHDGFVERKPRPAELRLDDDAEALALAYYFPARWAVTALGREGSEFGICHGCRLWRTTDAVPSGHVASEGAHSLLP